MHGFLEGVLEIEGVVFVLVQIELEDGVGDAGIGIHDIYGVSVTVCCFLRFKFDVARHVRVQRKLYHIIIIVSIFSFKHAILILAVFPIVIVPHYSILSLFRQFQHPVDSAPVTRHVHPFFERVPQRLRAEYVAGEDQFFFPKV